MIKVVIATYFLLFTQSALSAQLTGIELIKETMRRYQGAAAVEIHLSKTVTLSLLDETKKSDGRLVFSKGRLRLEIFKPEESIIVMNNNTLWVETPTPIELGGKTQVIKIQSKDLSSQAKAPLAALLGKISAWDQLTVKTEVETKDGVTMSLVPKKENALGEIVSVSLVIAKKARELIMISYKDELDNETKFEFNKTNFGAKADKNVFVYMLPKNAELTEY